jgi:hypothetical protein
MVKSAAILALDCQKRSYTCGFLHFIENLLHFLLYNFPMLLLVCVVLERDCQALEFHVHHDPLIMRVRMIPKNMLLDILFANKSLFTDLTLPLLEFVSLLMTRQLDGVSIFAFDHVGLDHLHDVSSPLGITRRIWRRCSNESESLIIRDTRIDTAVVSLRDWFVTHNFSCIPWDQRESA